MEDTEIIKIVKRRQKLIDDKIRANKNIEIYQQIIKENEDNLNNLETKLHEEKWKRKEADKTMSSEWDILDLLFPEK